MLWSGRSGCARLRILLLPAIVLAFTAPAPAQSSSVPTGTSTEGPLTLDEAERLAESVSPVLKAADARIRIEEGRRVQAGLYPNPDLSLDVTRFTHDFSPREAIVSLRQPIPWRGKRGLARSEATERIEAARRERERQRLDLLFEVREGYYRIYFAGEVVKVEEENLEATRAMKKAVDARVAAGDAAPFESLKAAVEVKRAEGRAEMIRGELAARTASFNLMLGRPPSVSTAVTQPALELEPREELPQLQAKALAAQPEIQARHHEALAAGFAAQRARLEPRPDIAVGPLLGNDQGSPIVGAGVSLTLPLWNRNRGGVAAAVAAKDEASDLEDAARLAVSRLVADAYELYRAARTQKDLYEQGLLSQTEELLQTARKSYEGGETGILDLLDARRTALAVREEYYRAGLDSALAALRLRRAVGDDSEGGR